MAIDIKTITLEELDAEGLEELRSMIETLTGEKAALKAKNSELLGEKKNLAAKLKPWENLQSELELTDTDEVKELIITARGVSEDPEGSSNPLAEQVRDLKEAREREKAELKRAMSDKEAAWATEKTALEATVAGKQQELSETIMQTKLREALAGKFNVADDASIVLGRKGYSYALAEPEDDTTPLTKRPLVFYKGNKTTVPLDVDSIIADIEQDRDCQHYLKSTFAGGGGGFNPGARVAGADNPWAKETFNRTKQLMMINEDPAKAKALEAAASKQ